MARRCATAYRLAADVRFYLNELLLHLLPREDAHPALFSDYYAAIRGLASTADVAPVLRRFEMQLLQSLGYGADLGRTSAGVPVRADHLLSFCIAAWLVEGGTPDETCLRGATLLNMAAGVYSDA